MVVLRLRLLALVRLDLLKDLASSRSEEQQLVSPLRKPVTWMRTR